MSALAPGFLIMNILGVNNYRDIESDRKVGKMTLSARIGRRASLNLFVILTVAAYAVPVIISLRTGSAWALLPIISLPKAVKLIKSMRTLNGSELNSVLAGSGQLVFMHGALTSISFIIMRLV
jgi:1,4-dihydroxy-2-naphthoate octaprenyltransferase